ncbi:SPFH domain-containing protein [Frigoriglobus tundricola]|uniref:SPFH domain / Band 7 family protein n=1 Tax=Frigoriglobus tundricola TaxID=2774151 RepID=A0A6M5YTY5_9BACT|nr:SPFH domain-containing protein [Frigoriglobus tundricola]QJW97547.1 SPFH domain / Band 7 family protein [Frigoriglobus tundricola]
MEDRDFKPLSGWAALFAMLVGLGVIITLIALAVQWEERRLLWGIVPLSVLWVIAWAGFIVNGPNQARVVQLFGRYVGTVRATGFFYGSPLYWRTRVSLRVRTFETGVDKTDERKDAAGNVVVAASSHRRPLKVNDKDGTPIEIAAVVVWRVVNAADAVFQVDDYEEFVKLQADAALRNLASRYSYDGDGRTPPAVVGAHPEAATNEAHALRGHIEEVAAQLKLDIQERMRQAGVEVLESRISYLAYAPEIAAAMLQRQQAGAIIAARAKIVEGAVGMVEHALQMLSEKQIIDLDPERRAAMVSNLLVVLCSHSNPQPVLNTGTLYN